MRVCHLISSIQPRTQCTLHYRGVPESFTEVAGVGGDLKIVDGFVGSAELLHKVFAHSAIGRHNWRPSLPGLVLCFGTGFQPCKRHRCTLPAPKMHSIIAPPPAPVTIHSVLGLSLAPVGITCPINARLGFSICPLSPRSTRKFQAYRMADIFARRFVFLP